MADIKFSALTDGGQPVATDRMPAVRAGANVKIAPAVPFGPYADAAALQTAVPASVALAGRVANVGSGAPYSIYRCDGAAWVDVLAGLPPVLVAASRALTAADNGKVLECTASVSLTVPAGLPAGFGCSVLRFGTTSILSTGGVLLNGATTTVTRTTDGIFAIVGRTSAANSYAVTGA